MRLWYSAEFECLLSGCQESPELRVAAPQKQAHPRCAGQRTARGDQDRHEQTHNWETKAIGLLCVDHSSGVLASAAASMSRFFFPATPLRLSSRAWDESVGHTTEADLTGELPFGLR